jgi:hypothetical protein
MPDVRFHGRVDGCDDLCPALSRFRIDGCDDEQTIETRIGLSKAFGPVVVPESSLSRFRDGFESARDSHYLVPAGTLQQFPDDGSAQMTAGATHTDFHVSLQHFCSEQIVRWDDRANQARGATCVFPTFPLVLTAFAGKRRGRRAANTSYWAFVTNNSSALDGSIEARLMDCLLASFDL